MTEIPTPSAGQVWASKSEDVVLLLLGAKKSGWFGDSSRGGVEGPIPTEELLNGWRLVACTHSEYCCATHDFHTSPHKGCILR